jgi:hypothetical protein
MAVPAPKTVRIERLLNATGSRRLEAIKNDRCVSCAGPASSFSDDLSRREYQISGMCQACQDQFFVDDED